MGVMVTETVGTASIVAMIFTLVLSLILPIILLVVYAGKNKNQGVVSAWFLGAAGFFVTQIAIRMQLLTRLSLLDGFQSFAENQYLLYIMLLAVTAALFELVGRYAVAKGLGKTLTYKKAFAAGLGHGGIEAIIIIGMSYISNLGMALMINSGMFNLVMAHVAEQGIDASAYQILVDTLVDTPFYMYLLAGYERILTMIAHTAMSLIVCYFVWKKQDIKGIGICLVIHTLLDGVVGILSGLATPYMGSMISQNVSYVIIYVYLTIVAVLSVIVIRKIKAAWHVEKCQYDAQEDVSEQA